MSLVSRSWWLPLALALLGACAPRGTARYDRDQLAESLAEPRPDAGLVIGEFTLASPAVVDGDTIKVVGIEGTLRLLGIDTEETFKSDKDRRAYDEGFEVYLAKKQEGHDRPIKAATPLGMDAKHWAEDFFEGVRTVRLERDHPKELRGRYGRLLTYVMVEKDGEWLNYNVECVRAGMSPYFSKYGYSRRFHEQFVQAQAEAQAAKIGIWDPDKEHYPDYDLRLRWWNARAEVIARFEEEAQGRENWVALTNWDSLDRLDSFEGEEVVLLASVGDVFPREGKKPARVMLSRRMFSDFPLVFFDDEVLDTCGIEQARGEFVRVQGTVSRYVFRTKRKKLKKGQEPPSQLQIRVQRPEQVSFVDTRPARIAGGYAPKMPPAEAEAEVDPDAPPTAPEQGEGADLMLVCRPDGSLVVGGAVMADDAQVREAVGAALAEDPQRAAIIHCDVETSHERTVEVIDLLRELGVQRYAIATEDGEGPSTPIDEPPPEASDPAEPATEDSPPPSTRP